MNAAIERWIGGCRRELLDRTFAWNQDHLRRILHAYEIHHNQHRPHRSLNSAAPLKPLPEPVDLGRYHVRRQAHTGCLINEYRLVALRGRGCRVAGGISAPGSQGTVRNNLSLHGSCRSGHQTAGIQVTQAQCAKKRGRCRTALFHASCALRRPRSRLCFLRSQRSK